MLAGITLGLVTGLGTVLYIMNRQERMPSSVEAVESFVKSICLGEAGPPGAAGATLCGYAIAWDMLSATLQAEVPYSLFYDEFAAVTERHGPVQKMEQVRPARSRFAVRYTYRLWFGSPLAPLEDHQEFLIEVAVRWDGDRWFVTHYELRPATEREMR